MLLSELRDLQGEIRTAQRGESLRAFIAILVPVIAATATTVSRGPLLVVAPLIIAFVSVYQLNAAAHEECLRIYRDRLVAQLGEEWPVAVSRDPLISRVRGCHMFGVYATTLLAAVLFLGLAGWGIATNARLGMWSLVYQLGSLAIGLVAVGMAHFSKEASKVDAVRRIGLTAREK